MDIKKEVNVAVFAFAVVSVIVGILLIVFNKALATVIPYVVGSLVLIDGVVALINYFGHLKSKEMNHFDLVRGVIDVVLGILILLSTEFFTTAFGILVGICLLLWGLLKLNYSFTTGKANGELVPELIESIIFVVAGIVMLVFSKSVLDIIVIVLGASLIAIGLYVAAKAFVVSKKLSKLEKQNEEIVVEGKVVEDEQPAGETPTDNAPQTTNEEK